jgi:hypothetical protein
MRKYALKLLIIESCVLAKEAGRGEPMAILYCACGHEIWSELWWKEPRHVLLFFDDLEKSETYGERVTHCPGCGQQIGRALLTPGSGKYDSGAWRQHETV